MSQLPDQVINPTGVPFMGSMNPGLNLINPSQFQGPIQQTIPQPQNMGIPVGAADPKNQEKRHRRSKHEQEGRNFRCDCGKSFLSQPALNNHKKTKHPELLKGQPKRGRGRPRKYPPKNIGDFEYTKYDTFFNNDLRKNDPEKSIDMHNVVTEVFNFIYKSSHSDALFSHPNSYEENPILKNLFDDAPASTKPKNLKNCNEVFYEYLQYFKRITNEKYFKLLLKFILLFRECYDLSKNKDLKEGEEKKAVTDSYSPEGLPDLCNEFYGEFLEPNNFFGLNEENEKNEIIEIIQHFCIWLFKCEYTKSKLSLAN